MKNILCFGDSNTWGYIPLTAKRFPHDVRWPGVMARELGSDYHIIEEALSGRTTVHDDAPGEDIKSGKRYLLPCLKSHEPLDLVILVLGGNDTKQRFGVQPLEIGRSIAQLVKIVQSSESGADGKAPAILLGTPINVGRGIKNSPFYGIFDESSVEKSYALPPFYKEVADKYGCRFIDTGALVEIEGGDGIHMNEEQHAVIGRAMAQQVKAILG